jgi:DNA polymerase III delta prime subunit
MTSFVIIAKNKEKRITYAADYCHKLKIDTFDITLIERDETKSSIGIEDVKNMQKKLFLKPLKSPAKALLIEESHLLTTEAQNALLKVLEEPPSNTIIMLLSESKESLLPTIISRCKVITLEEEKVELSKKELEEYETFITNLPNLSVGERLKKAELLAKDKEKGIEWIGKLILILRERLLETYSSSERSESRSVVLDLARTINSFQELNKLLKTTNVNPRFAIESTLLSISSQIK